MATRFPDAFLFGAATAAYQIEGFPLADGAGPSIWHRFSHTPGRVENGETGDRACEHYRRSDDDVALMAELGLNAYRFSLSWSRILPEGLGATNAPGIGFYDRLVDALLARGIQPMVTLYHWDLPAALDDRGGWLNRDIAEWFAEYARIAYRALGDRVRLWATLNEPWVVADAGYLHGVHAPGHRSVFEAPIASHHLLLAHAAAVEAFRAESIEGSVGIVVNLAPKDPASDRPEDLEAARRSDAYMNRHYLDPIFRGAYPDELAEMYGEAWPDFDAADLARIGTPIDFVGINYYTRSVDAHDPDPLALPPRVRPVRQERSTHTDTGWEVHPDGLLRILLWVHERYGPLPLYITENGAAFYDSPSAPEEGVRDPLRTAYYGAHLRAAREAIERGVDLRGYFAWSLLDNFEWACGYSKRFGIVHVDYATQARTIKESGRFYAEVIRSRGAALGTGVVRVQTGQETRVVRVVPQREAPSVRPIGESERGKTGD